MMWLVDGTASLGDLLEEIGGADLVVSAPGDVSTVGGLVQKLLDRVPGVGNSASWSGLSLEVLEMDGLRIGRILVTPASDPADAP